MHRYSTLDQVHDHAAGERRTAGKAAGKDGDDVMTRAKNVYRIEISRTDSWSYIVRAADEETAERAALADFRAHGGTKIGWASVGVVEQIDVDDADLAVELEV